MGIAENAFAVEFFVGLSISIVPKIKAAATVKNHLFMRMKIGRNSMMLITHLPRISVVLIFDACLRKKLLLIVNKKKSSPFTGLRVKSLFLLMK